MTHSLGLLSTESKQKQGRLKAAPRPRGQRGKHGAGEINTAGHEAVSHGHLVCVLRGNKTITAQMVSPAGPAGTGRCLAS